MTQTYPMLIGADRVDSNKLIDVLNPRTEALIGQVFEGSVEQMDDALLAAKEGFSRWSKMSTAERKTRILNYADLLDQHLERLVELLMQETGKPRENAEYDFGMLTTCLRFFVEEAERIDQPVLHDPDGRFLHYVQRQPLGVTVGFLAWNFPLLNLGYKLGPVLASGCSCILKPSELTPLATLEAVYLAAEAGIPDGVINVVTCSDYSITNRLLESPVPAMVTMIGSTRGGLEVMGASCTTIKHFSVELGGNSPVLVYDDADVQMAAEKVIGLKFVNTGQVCVSPNRCYVHTSIYDAFVEAAAECAAGVDMGPMITAKARDQVLEKVDEALQAGATLVCGGSRVDGVGYFMEPTILRDVDARMRVACEEVFGPVLSILPFTDADDEIALANETSCGLAAYVFTKGLSRGLRAAEGIEAGSVCVNEPHYGVQLPHGGIKQSGVGKDCSRYSLEEYLTLKRVSVLLD